MQADVEQREWVDMWMRFVGIFPSDWQSLWLTAFVCDFAPICGPFEAVLASFWWPRHPYGDPGTPGRVQKWKRHQKHGSRVRRRGPFQSLFWSIFQLHFVILFWNQLFQAVCGFGAQNHARRRPKGSKHEPESAPGSILCNVLEAWYLLHRKQIGASRDGSGDQLFADPIPRRSQDGSRDRLLMIFLILGVLGGSFWRTFSFFFSIGKFVRFLGLRPSADNGG